jgi:hypothetical protein
MTQSVVLHIAVLRLRTVFSPKLGSGYRRRSLSVHVPPMSIIITVADVRLSLHVELVYTTDLLPIWTCSWLAR